MTDLVVLRATLDALSALMAELDQYVSDLDQDPSTVGTRSRRTGVRASKDIALRHHGWATAQLHRHGGGTYMAVPTVRDPAQLDQSAARLMGGQGHPAVAVLTADATALAGGSAGVSTLHLWMPPDHVGLARVHHHTTTVIVVHHGTMEMLWWDDHEQWHALTVTTGQHLRVPPGMPYAVLNPHADVAIGTEYRNHPHAHLDTHVLPHLGPRIHAYPHTPEAPDGDTGMGGSRDNC